ncbi:MAG: alternative ribosome rescue aminoacyl-tRNA hydrolase ArfB [bacterium]
MQIQITLTITIPEKEFQFQFTRASGPGGQNVNKVSSRVELLFDVNASPSLSEAEKESIRTKLRSRIDSDGVLHIASQESRSQWKNRGSAVEKFVDLLRGALMIRKKRMKTKPSRSAKEVRIKTKKNTGTKKKLRGRVNPFHE